MAKAEKTSKAFEQALKHPEKKIFAALIRCRYDAKVCSGRCQYQEDMRGTSPGAYDLEVIDIYQQPTLAKGEQIIARLRSSRNFPSLAKIHRGYGRSREDSRRSGFEAEGLKS